MNFENYILEKIKLNNIYVEDGKCIDEVNDYKDVILELFSLSGDDLQLSSFSGEENDGIKLLIIVNKIEYIIILEYGSGFLDSINLVKGLNQILQNKKSKYRFYTFWAVDCFGQEVGFFYTEITIGNKIINYAKKHNSTVDIYIEQYQITDGTTQEGYENND